MDRTAMEVLKEKINSLDVKRDIIPAIFYKMKCTEIPDGFSAVQNIIYILKQDERYKELLNDYNYNTNGIKPYCEELEVTISRLMISELLMRLNLSTYVKSEPSKLSKSFERFDIDDKRRICEMAKIADSLVESKSLK